MTVPTYGDTTAEYVALHVDAAAVDGRYELVSVRGPDAVGFLDSILSQDIAGMATGAVARSFLLQPQGKLTAVLWVLRDEEDCFLLADPGYGSVTVSELSRYLLRVKVQVEIEDTPVRTVIGPQAAARLSDAGINPPTGWHRHGEAIVANVPLTDGVDRFIVAGTSMLDSLPRAGSIAADAVRVEAGDVVMGIDIDEKTIPQESGLVASAVSFTKGCYLGQELVARIDSRGHVNRTLVAISVGSNVVPPAGAQILANEKVVGVLTSPSESLNLRAPVGLALIRREVEHGDTVEIQWDGGSSPGTVLGLPTSAFTDF